jgi:integrase
VPGRCFNTEPSTDHSVLVGGTVAPTKLSPFGESRNRSLRRDTLSVNFNQGEFHMEEKQQKRARGSGSIFQNGSAVWWIKFYDRGIPRRESSHSTDPKVAEKLLKRRLAEVETDTFIPRQNIRIDDLVRDVLDDHRANGRKSTEHVEARWRLHLAEFFSRLKASELKTDRIQRYIEHRLDQGAERATINRELSLLKRALRLAFKAGKLRALPFIPMLKENNARRGFLELDGYARLAGECAKVGLWLRALLETAYAFGFRLGELRSMRCRQVNLLTGTISLETSKNGEPRETYMTSSVRELLTPLVLGKKPDEFVFTRDGCQQLGDFRKTWARCCTAAGVGAFHCPSCDELIKVDSDGTCAHCAREWRRSELRYRGLIFHDLRRCAVRGLIRAGVAQKTAMCITGHRTVQTFHRYQIIAPADLQNATRKLEISQEQERELLKSHARDFGQSLGRVARKTGQTSTCGVSAPTPAALPN